MNPTALRACLSCPVCFQPLRAPSATTLRCGHTVCSEHCAHSISCPVPQCTPNHGPARPRIPPASRVHYMPPPPSAPGPSEPVEVSKPDVTINKIIELLDRHLQSEGRVRDVDDVDGDWAAPSLSSSRQRSHSPPSRPSKRRRHDRSNEDDDDDGEGNDDDLLSHLRASAARERSTLPQIPLRNGRPPVSTFEKEMLTEMSCEICFMLLYNPVTTPCQHTFCAKCLHRSLDHSPLCPLCRESLPGFSFFEDQPCNQTLEALIVTAFPELYTDRKEAIEAEERDARLDTPIFVCMLVFPGHPTALHFFEPRYRLMLRRCLEKEVPSFGMIMPARPGAGAGVTGSQIDYGTMLEIRSVQMLPDGRSMVETWSTYRFRILERGTLDGYTVGRIERIDDVPDSPPLPFSGPSNEELMTTCTNFLLQLRRGTAPWVVQRLNNVYGPPPTDPAAFSYWVALVLPIDEYEKAKLLPIRSTHMRLRLVVHWIEQLNSNWWFASGCVVL